MRFMLKGYGRDELTPIRLTLSTLAHLAHVSYMVGDRWTWVCAAANPPLAKHTLHSLAPSEDSRMAVVRRIVPALFGALVSADSCPSACDGPRTRQQVRESI